MILMKCFKFETVLKGCKRVFFPRRVTEGKYQLMAKELFCNIRDACIQYSEQENFLVLLLSINVWQSLSCFLWFSTNRFIRTILVNTRERLKTYNYPAVFIYMSAFSISRNIYSINKYKIFAYIICIYFQNRRGFFFLYLISRVWYF